MVHDHQIDTCVSECLRDNYLVLYYSHCTQHHWAQKHGKSWMTANMLQINMDKMEVLVLMNKSLRNPITINKIKIDSIDISTASNIRHFGAISDSALSSEVLWTPSANLPGSIYSTSAETEGLLTTYAANIFIQACDTSKIDYCNSLL